VSRVRHCQNPCKAATSFSPRLLVECRFKIQRSGREGIVRTRDQLQPSQLGAPSRADLHGLGEAAQGHAGTRDRPKRRTPKRLQFAFTISFHIIFPAEGRYRVFHRRSLIEADQLRRRSQKTAQRAVRAFAERRCRKACPENDLDRLARYHARRAKSPDLIASWYGRNPADGNSNGTATAKTLSCHRQWSYTC
jgi:hypothetical protein